MKTGDLVKFAKEHHEMPGLEYCKSWTGIILKATTKEVKIYWVAHGSQLVAEYDDVWWRKLYYKPFEVINESR